MRIKDAALGDVIMRPSVAGILIIQQATVQMSRVDGGGGGGGHRSPIRRP